MTNLYYLVTLFSVMGFSLCVSAQTGDPVNRPIITSFTPAGTLTWTNLVPHSACTVEKAFSPNGPWTNISPQHSDILTGDNTTLSAVVPVTNEKGFFRVAMTPPFNVAWCRLQDDTPMYVVLDNDMSVAGRVRVPGLTDRTDGVDTNVLVRAQVGYRPNYGGSPSAYWTWRDAVQQPGWSSTAAGEANVDEYVGTLRLPGLGDYWVAVRFSGDGGNTWLWGDLNEGPGSDGSENGFDLLSTRRVGVRSSEFKVLSAVSVSPTQVVVYLNQEMDGGSINQNGSQFTFNNGLLAFSAVMNGTSVMLTTSLQVPNQNYTVTVQEHSLQDVFGNSLSSSANTAIFTGQ